MWEREEGRRSEALPPQCSSLLFNSWHKRGDEALLFCPSSVPMYRPRRVYRSKNFTRMVKEPNLSWEWGDEQGYCMQWDKRKCSILERKARERLVTSVSYLKLQQLTKQHWHYCELFILCLSLQPYVLKHKNSLIFVHLALNLSKFIFGYFSSSLLLMMFYCLTVRYK